jgi:hypothetical protein
VHSLLGKETVEDTMRSLVWCLALPACHESEYAHVALEGEPGAVAGASAEAEGRLDSAHALAVTEDQQVQLLYADGSARTFFHTEQIEVPYPVYAAGAAHPDGDGLLMPFVYGTHSGIARVGAEGQLDGWVGGSFGAIDAVRDPADDTLIVASLPPDPGQEVHPLLWLPGDGSSSEPVRALDAQDEGWDAAWIQAIERVEGDGRTWLLVSAVGPEQAEGCHLELWDITDPEALWQVWRYPAEGGLGVVDSPILRRYEGQWWLAYAHRRVGLAVTDSLRVPPAYVADLAPAGGSGAFEFLTGVELTSDGVLYLSERISGRVLEVALPEGLAPTGASGVAPGGQVLVEVPAGEVVMEGLAFPSAPRLWELPQ